MATRIQQVQPQQLVEEFEANIGLSPTESRRSAFIALALVAGWNNARIGRYLGVHRQRISQKLDKYTQYIEAGRTPLLKKVMAGVKPCADNAPGVVAFQQTDWEDEAFANGMLGLVDGVERQRAAA